ncbi:MAG: putative metal-binding motif-containing protein [Myxococcaceae bacterium]|nr:putative metal-binding motif-containing protein [Myxococcaceae bacterium]
MRSLLLLTPVLASCFQPWSADGLYRCGAGCPADMTCDDGLCCRQNGTPACPTLVPASGKCEGGSNPKVYFQDTDGDGYGNPLISRTACGRPTMETWVDSATDCDDGSMSAFPGGTEVCDGRDNDCDGTVDEGQTPVAAYYRDTDGDGFGVMGDVIMACQCPQGCVPPGYSANAGDCAPNDNTKHPMAPELCNGADDNCNNQTDENVTVGVGVACADAGLGECNAGLTACVAGAIACRPAKLPSRDLCNGLDDDCDGTADERPDCGGPSSFFDAGLVLGARDTGMTTGLNPPTSCLRALGMTEPFTGLTWSGSGDEFHVWYAEAPAGKTWDLSGAGLSLHLQFTSSMLNGNTSVGPWNNFNQPFVLVCSEAAAQFSRYRPAAASLLTSANVTVNTDMPLAGGGAWLLALGGADLTQVKRIEVVVQPTNNGASIPSFNNVFNTSTGFRP